MATMLLTRLAIFSSSLVALCGLFSILAITVTLRSLGVSDEVAFQHLAEFPWGAILKIVLVVLAFIATNEMLAHRMVSVESILKIFAISMLMSMFKYYFDSIDMIVELNIATQNEFRPYPKWIGGWNTYAFLLSIFFLIIYYGFFSKGFLRLLLLATVFLTILSTLSRAGLGALVLAIAFDFVAIRSFHRIKRKKSLIARLNLLTLCGGAMAVLATKGDLLVDRFLLSFVESQYEGVDLLQSVTSGRTIQWIDTITKIVDPTHIFQWFFGYGIGHYAWGNAEAVETEMHNQYLLFFYEYGLVIGAILSFLLLRSPFALSWRSAAPLDRLARAVLVIYVITNLVEGLIYTTQAGWILGLFGAFVFRIYQQQQIKWTHESRQ